MVEFLKLVPVWVGPLVAVSVFLLVRYVLPVLMAKPTGGFDSGTVIRQFMPLFAWLLGGGLLLAWVAAEIHKLSNRVMFDRQTGISSVRDLSWQQFEHLVSEAYRRRGYTTRVVGSPSGDGGVDIELARPGETVLVQCKHWKAWSVGVTTVRELLGVVVSRRATRGILVTSGRFTEEAQRFGDLNSQVELVDGTRLTAMIAEVKSGEQALGTAGAPPPPMLATSPSIASPLCPVCRSQMVMRTAKKGAKAWSQFWGCPRYPACRGIRPATT